MLISPEYVALNEELHRRKPSYGTNNTKDYIHIVRQLMEFLGTKDILDYGCGKGDLARFLDFPIKEYDPAIPEKSAIPEPADIVVCTDVLEHVESECLDDVLSDLRRCVKRVGLFIIPTHPSSKFLADGRNAHLIQKGKTWWEERISAFFTIHTVKEVSCVMCSDERFILVGSRVYMLVRHHTQGDNGNGRG